MTWFLTRGPLGVLRGVFRKGERFFPATSRSTVRMIDNFSCYMDGKFDREFGIETSGKILTSNFIESQESGSAYIWYEPCPAIHFEIGVKALNIDPAAFTLYDIGSGLGRIPFLAARHGFARAIGVELNHSLNEMAKKNLAKLNAPWADRVKFIEHDATSFDYGSGNRVYFLFTPFTGEIMAKFIERVKALSMQGDRCYILYYGNNPENTEVIADAFGAPTSVELPMIWSRSIQYRMCIFQA